MTPPLSGRGVATRPMLVSSVLLAMTLLLIYVLIAFPRPFLFVPQSTTAIIQLPTTTIVSTPATTSSIKNGYSKLNDTFSRMQIPLYNIPYLYVLRLKVFMPWKTGVDFSEDNWLLTGSCTIHFTVAVQNTRVQVHMLGQHVVALTLQDDIGRNISTQISHDYPHVLDIRTEHELLPNMNYSLRINYTSRIEGYPYAENGLYYLPYYNGSEERNMIATHLQAQAARKMFPCVDVPEAKARFLATIVHPVGTTAVSNAQERSIVSEGNWTTTKFEPSPLMSTYLFALAVSDFSYKQSYYKDIRLRVYAPTSDIEYITLALSLLPRFIQYFEDYFNISIPLKKLDLHYVPNMKVRAMENWGLITLKPHALLFYNDSTRDERIRVVETIAHEVAHQWFGNLVTMKWWNNLWLNEGFATMIANKLMDGIEGGDYHYHRNLALHFRFAQDPRKTSVISRKEEPTFDPDAQFEHSYTKPMVLLKMIEKIVGENAYQMGLRRFLKRFAYRNADHEDLMETLTYAHDSSSGSHLSGQSFSLNEVIETWIYQRGCPLVTVKQREPGVQLVTQKAYWHTYKAPKAWSQQQWKIPLFLRHPVTKEPTISWLLENSTVSIDLGEDAVLDRSVITFMRILYDDELYDVIINKLHTNPDSIPINSRARLMDDCMTLAEQGSLSYAIALNISTYLQKETECPPVIIFHFHADFLYSRLNVAGSVETLKLFLATILSPIFHKFIEKRPSGLIHGETQTYEAVFKRVCYAGYFPCIDVAKKWVSELAVSCNGSFLSSKCNQIPEFVRMPIYSTAVMFGDETMFEFMHDAYLRERDPEEKLKLWVGMVASLKKSHIYKAWDLFLFNGTYHMTEIENYAEYAKYLQEFYHIENHFLPYMLDNIDRILEKLPQQAVSSLMTTLGRSVTLIGHLSTYEAVTAAVLKKYDHHEFPMTRSRAREVVNWRREVGDYVIANMTRILQQIGAEIPLHN